MKKLQFSGAAKILLSVFITSGFILNASAQKQDKQITETQNVLIFGTVVSDSSKIIPGAAISVHWIKYNKKGSFVKNLTAYAMSDSSGKFAVELPVIPFEIEASKSGYFPATVKKLDSAELLNGIKLVLKSGGKIKVLINSMDPDELAKSEIKAFILGKEYPDINEIQIAAPIRQGVNPFTGHLDTNYIQTYIGYCWIEGVPAGSGEIQLMYKGKLYSKTIEIKGGTTTDVSFDILQGLFFLSGCVTEHGKPSAGYLLTFNRTDDKDTPIKGYITNTYGEFLMKLDSGTYEIQLHVLTTTEIQGIKTNAWEAIYTTSHSLVKNHTLNLEIDDLMLIEAKENK